METINLHDTSTQRSINRSVKQGRTTRYDLDVPTLHIPAGTHEARAAYALLVLAVVFGETPADGNDEFLPGIERMQVARLLRRFERRYGAVEVVA